MSDAVSFDRFISLNYLNGSELFQGSENKLNKESNKLLEEYKGIILQQIISQFGIGQLLNGFKDGGNITTMHNANKGIFADEKTKQRYNREYKHEDYSKNRYTTNKKGEKVLEVVGLNTQRYQGKKVREDIRNKLTPEWDTPDRINIKDTTNPKTSNKQKVLLSKSAKNNINQFKKSNINKKGYMIDGYSSNRTTENHSNFHVDHVVAAKEYHDNLRMYMSEKDIAKAALDNKNLAPTDGSANQSKGKRDLLEWSESNSKKEPDKTNIERFNLSEEEVKERYKQAKKHYEHTKRKAQLTHYSREIGVTGIAEGNKIANKRMLGLLLYELAVSFSKEMKDYLGKYKTLKGLKQKLSEFTKHCNNIKNHLWEKKWQIFQGYSEGFISGFLSNIMTFIINIFSTTYKRIVKLISDNFTGIVSTVKIFLDKSGKYSSSSERYKAVIKILVTTLIGSIGGILTEGLIMYLKTTPFALFSQMIGTIIGGIFTGIVTASALYILDDFSGFINSLKDMVKSIFEQEELSQKELKVKFHQLIVSMDSEYEQIAKRILREYRHLLQVTQRAYDMTVSSTKRLASTVEYAIAFDVNESDIVTDVGDIDDFFLN